MVGCVRESRHAGRQIFRQQRPWLLTLQRGRAPLVSGSLTARGVLPWGAWRRRRAFGRGLNLPGLALHGAAHPQRPHRGGRSPSGAWLTMRELSAVASRSRACVSSRRRREMRRALRLGRRGSVAVRR
jgi:hypothetical protein